MRRLLPFGCAVVTLVALGSACSGSDDDPGPITRIDGPATIDEDILNGSGDDGSSDG